MPVKTVVGGPITRATLRTTAGRTPTFARRGVEVAAAGYQFLDARITRVAVVLFPLVHIDVVVLPL